MKTTEIPSPEPAQDSQIEPLFFDINQAAKALNMSTKTIRRLILLGKLTRCSAVRKILIPRKQIEDFIKATCAVPSFKF